ncbi:segregation/condensation protein A [Candidatus Saccharibacteria bacterium]|nr:segregation/condensation protein A [Candidatus Saccharibacteria bacterium]
MPPSIVINQFEGPLALLLELVERNQMPVTDIAVAAITNQYLQQIAELEGLTPEALGDFLQLGSRLVYIKSRALLPLAETDDQADELRELTRELAEYKRYQAAAKVLATRTNTPSWHRPVAAKLSREELPLPEIDITELAAAFQTALARLEPAKPSRVISAQLSQAEVLKKLEHRLSLGAFELSHLLADLTDRLEVVVTFSALLELIRSGRSRVTQTAQFQPIMVEPIHV